MDPEILRDLLQQAQAAREQGRSMEEINTRLREVTNGDIGSTTALRAAVQQFEGGDVPGGAAGATARQFGRGLTASFLDELSGLLAGAGAAAVPGGEGFGEARRRATEESRGRAAADREAAGGILSTAGEVAGSLAPGGAIFKGVRGATRLGPAAAGALSGALEGGLFGAGSGEGVEDRAIRGGVGAAGGGILGGAAGGTGGLLVAGRRASRAKPEAGRRLGEAAREASDLEGRPSGILDDVQAGKREARELVRPLERMGREEIPEEIGETVMNNPVLREEAERVAPRAVEAAAEEGGQAARFTFDELDTIARSLRNDANAFKRAAGSDLPANVRPVNVKRAESALDDLDEVMRENLERFPEFRARWATEKARQRALLDGRKLWSKTADDVQSAFNELDDPQAREAFREGLATEFIAHIEKLTEPKAALRRIVNSPQTRGKLRVMMGDDGLQRFTEAAKDEQALRNLAHDYEAVKRFVRRYVPGGAIAGGGVEGGRRLGGILFGGDEGGN